MLVRQPEQSIEEYKMRVMEAEMEVDINAAVTVEDLRSVLLKWLHMGVIKPHIHPPGGSPLMA